MIRSLAKPPIFRFLGSMQTRDQSKPALVRTAKLKIEQYFSLNPNGLTMDSLILGTDNPYLNPITPTFPEYIMAILTGRNRPNLETLLPDWLITSHVT